MTYGSPSTSFSLIRYLCIVIAFAFRLTCVLILFYDTVCMSSLSRIIYSTLWSAHSCGHKTSDVYDFTYSLPLMDMSVSEFEREVIIVVKDEIIEIASRERLSKILTLLFVHIVSVTSVIIPRSCLRTRSCCLLRSSSNLRALCTSL